MSFDSSESEMKRVWVRPEVIRLFKLYDKVSNLLDGRPWMDKREGGYREKYERYTLELADDVERNFGSLNICRIARAICEAD